MRQLVRDLRTHFPAYAALAAASWRDMRRRRTEVPANGSRTYRVLEVGCGALYPYVALFHSAGTSVVGIDVLPLVKRDLRAAKYLDIRRARGAVTALRRLGSDLLFHAAFYRPLGRAAGLAIRHPGVQLVRMDATRCGFADGSFDVVYSSACFEHLPDVPGAVAEIDRVLTPRGIAEIEIHLFTSMTGGHEPVLHDHQVPPAGFPLWGHLVDLEWQPSLFLNRWSDRQFRDAFAARFEIVDRQVTSRHGEQYLGREIEARLAWRYTRDELTTESVLYVLQKR